MQTAWGLHPVEAKVSLMGELLAAANTYCPLQQLWRNCVSSTWATAAQAHHFKHTQDICKAHLPVLTLVAALPLLSTHLPHAMPWEHTCSHPSCQAILH